MTQPTILRPSPRIRRVPTVVALACAAFVLASCGGGAGDASITVGGTIANLTTDGLLLSDNGSSSISVAANATTFSFPSVSGLYSVTVLQQPQGQTCSVANGSGSSTSSVSNIVVSCRAYTLYAADADSHAIAQFGVGSDGALAPASTATLATPGGKPHAVVVAPDGNHAWVSYEDTPLLTNLSIGSTGLLGLGTGSPAALGDLDALALSPDGKSLYAAEFSNAKASQFAIDGNGLLSSSPVSSPNAGSNPAAVAVTADGAHVYVANGSDSTVSGFGFDGNGHLAALTGAPASTGTNTFPKGLATNPTTNVLYVTLSGSGRIVAYTVDPTTGGLTQRSSQATGSAPMGVAVTPLGNYAYVANSGDNTISQYTLAGGLLTPLSTPTVAAGQGPAAIAISPDGTHAYAANANDNTISQYVIGANGQLTPLSPAAVSSNGTRPVSIVVR